MIKAEVAMFDGNDYDCFKQQNITLSIQDIAS